MYETKLVRRRYMLLLVVCLGPLLFILYIFTIHEHSPELTGSSGIFGYTEWPKFWISRENGNHGCLRLSSNDTDIEKFVADFKKLKASENKICKKFLQDFNSIFEVTDRYSRPIHLPKHFEEKTRKSLNNNELFENMNHQHLIHVFNRLTFEYNVYNPLRAKRPKPSGTVNIWSYVNKISEETEKNCDMCHFLHETAIDELGRQETKLTVRVSNSFKIERWHGMIITKNSHHPTNFTMEELVMLFQDATNWANEAHVNDPHYTYPHLAWDTLYKSGASQVHPHVHVALSPNHYYGPMEQLRSVAENYFRKTGENFFTKLVEIYSILGLAVRYKSAVALSTITGKGDMEVMIMDTNPNRDLYSLLYFTIKMYHEMKIPCHSISMAWPRVGDSEKKKKKGQIPAIIRIMSRGDCMSQQNDISSLDLFLINYRDHDPWVVSRSLRKTVRKYGTDY